MRTPVEPSGVLDRGGRPTVRDLMSSLVFNPVDGTIRLNGDRLVMQRATAGAELRRELIRLLGVAEARVFLMRLGFLSGQADARFVRTNWPNLDAGDAFTAGTRLHTFSGVVRVETLYNDFDFRKKRFAAEFLWHDSVEATDFRRGRKATEPVCWMQVGYASGYATEFFDTLIVYKEVECAAQGHAHCRVVGKPADVWGAGEPDVVLFRERIVATSGAELTEPVRPAQRMPAQSGASELDRVILAPVRTALDRLAAMALPVLVTGASGTGRARAAHYLHRAAGGVEAGLRTVAGAAVDLALCAEIARHGRTGRRAAAGETVLIDAAETVPAAVQPHLARAIEDGLAVGGLRVVATAGEDRATLGPELWYVLGALAIRMPALAEREGQRADIARAMLPMLSARMGRAAPGLDPAAARAVEAAAWPGNLRQMQHVLAAVLAARSEASAITGAEIEAQLARGPLPRSAGGVETLLDGLMAEGAFSLEAFERSAYQAAVERAGGNLSAAARLLGLTRAQLAYRLGARETAS